MFNKNEVLGIMGLLNKKCKFFTSEAHLQMAFAAEVIKSNSNYVVIPEYSIAGNNKNDEIDLFIYDPNDKKKTMIEFKHKTLNHSKKKFKVDIEYDGMLIKKDHEPTNMGAPELGKYDCWSDIYRLEQHLKNRECDAAFFILITNDPRYFDESVGNGSKYGGFSLYDGKRSGDKEWTIDGKKLSSLSLSNKQIDAIKNTLGVPRYNNPIFSINGNYNKSKFEDYSKVDNYQRQGKEMKCDEYKQLVIKIQK